MEVGGRILRVAEPNTDIEARVVDEAGNVVVEGTPIATVDRERFELQVQSAKAEVNRAEQAIQAATIELNKTIPSQIRAAEAEKKRAKTEFDRSVRLVNQNAGAQSDVDRDEAAYQNTVAQIEQLNAQNVCEVRRVKIVEFRFTTSSKGVGRCRTQLERLCVIRVVSWSDF